MNEAFLRAMRTINSYLDCFLVPRCFHRARRQSVLDSINCQQREAMLARVNYYNKLEQQTAIHQAADVKSFVFPLFRRPRFSTYFLDLYEVLRYFPTQEHFRYLFGDVIHVPEEPTFVKSRPIGEDNINSVVMKLDKRRHFRFVKDRLSFSQKKDMLVSRTTWAKASLQRTLLNRMFLNHPMFNVGKTRMEEDEDFPESVRGFLTVKQQLEYKFIACIEGNDVASNLKWVMSSNSIAVMPRPCYETWFMEGTLKPDYHYIEVKPDFSDLVEKLEYYMAHPDESQAIIDHAHEYVAQFRDERMERAIQMMVAQKYFELTK